MDDYFKDFVVLNKRIEPSFDSGEFVSEVFIILKNIKTEEICRLKVPFIAEEFQKGIDIIETTRYHKIQERIEIMETLLRWGAEGCEELGGVKLL